MFCAASISIASRTALTADPRWEVKTVRSVINNNFGSTVLGRSVKARILHFEDIGGKSCQVAAGEGLDNGPFIDEETAAGIYQETAGLH